MGTGMVRSRRQAMSEHKITDVKTILTAPAGIDLVVVRVETDEPGLYGLGCGTFTQRALAVRSAVDAYLRPLLVGRDPQRIRDIWETAYHNAYWRNGPVLNNALSGVDMALWDIKGKVAGMPVYQLLGGKVREGASVYRHAGGRDEREVEDRLLSFMEQGYRYVRCQMGGYGGPESEADRPRGALDGAYFDPEAYARSVPRLFDHLRNKVGYEVELLHDVHERVPPITAVRMACELEPYRLFFLEDALAPEDVEWFEMIRGRTSTPLAMGELFNHPLEWRGLVTGRLIDFIRIHLSQIGGLTPALGLTSLCDTFGVRTAWHGPGDVSPVGHAMNVHLSVVSPNFGVLEWCGLDERLQEVFPGCPQVENGYVYPNEEPGLGIDIDEEKAREYPCKHQVPRWTQTRLPDGSAARP